MTFQEFKSTLSLDSPPKLNDFLTALWYDYKGDWGLAHDIIDPAPGKEASRIHAYLHRKEGDIWNADYWYRRAESNRPTISLDDEWEQLVIFHLHNII